MAACVLLKPRPQDVLKNQLTKQKLCLWSPLTLTMGSPRGAMGQLAGWCWGAITKISLQTAQHRSAGNHHDQQRRGVTFHPTFISSWCFLPPAAAPKQAPGARPAAKAAQHPGGGLGADAAAPSHDVRGPDPKKLTKTWEQVLLHAVQPRITSAETDLSVTAL